MYVVQISLTVTHNLGTNVRQVHGAEAATRAPPVVSGVVGGEPVVRRDENAIRPTRMAFGVSAGVG